MYEPGYADTLRAGERWPGCPCSKRLSMFLCSTTWRFKVKLVAVLVYHTQEADNSAGARISCTNSSFVLPCAQASNCIIVTKWVVAVVEDWSCLQVLQVLQVLGCLSHFPDTSCIFLVVKVDLSVVFYESLPHLTIGPATQYHCIHICSH